MKDLIKDDNADGVSAYEGQFGSYFSDDVFDGDVLFQ